MKVYNIEATDMGDSQHEIAAWIMAATHGLDYATAEDLDEGALIEKACRALGLLVEWDCGGLLVEWEGYFTSTDSCIVATYAEWVEELRDRGGDPAPAALARLRQVVKNDAGLWEEV